MEYNILLDSRLNEDNLQFLAEQTKNESYLEGTWIITENLTKFSRLILANYHENGVIPDKISIAFNLGFDILDKGINPKAETGADALSWLVEFCVQNHQSLPTILAHGENEVQNSNLKTIARNAKTIYKL